MDNFSLEVPQVYIRVLEVCNLNKEHMVGSLQCEVVLGPHRAKGRENPTWIWKDEEYVCAVNSHTDVIYLTLYSCAEVQRPVVGTVAIPLYTLYDETPRMGWYLFQDGTERTRVSPRGSLPTEVSTSITKNPQIKLQLHYTYSQGTDLGAKLTLQNRAHVLTQAVLDPQLELALALCQTVDITESQRLSSSMVNFFVYHSKIIPLLKTVIMNEVKNTSTAGILFRANSMAMKMLSFYARIVGRSYLEQLCAPIVEEICQDSRSVELDAMRMKPGDDLDKNFQHLCSLCENLLNLIYNSILNCPHEIRFLCRYLVDVVREKFPTQIYAAVGGFFFLRFICPAIAAPEGFNIVAETPSDENRRSLVLVTKTMQNLASGIQFGGKEEYMSPMNKFILQYTERFQKLIELLCDIDTKDYSEDGTAFWKDSDMNTAVQVHDYQALQDLTVIHKYAKNYMAKIQPLLGDKWDVKALVDSFQMEEPRPVPKLHTISSEQISKRGIIRLFALKRSASQPDQSLNFPDKLAFLKAFAQEVKVRHGIKKEDCVVLNEMATRNSNEEPTTFQGEAACQFSITLLTSLMDIVVKHSFHEQRQQERTSRISRIGRAPQSPTKGETICVVNWDEIADSPEYEAFFMESTKLKYVDVSSLEGPHKLAFFLNMCNMLATQVRIVQGEVTAATEKVKKLCYFSLWGYNIGGDFYNLLDLFHGILRGNSKHHLSSKPPFAASDRRLEFVYHPPTLDDTKEPLKVDGRVHFGVCFVSDPTMSVGQKEFTPVTIYDSNTVEEQLHDMTYQYCQTNISIHPQKREVSVPKVFSRYSSDFGKDKEGLALWLFPYLDNQPKLDLLTLIESKNFHLASISTPNLSRKLPGKFHTTRDFRRDSKAPAPDRPMSFSDPQYPRIRANTVAHGYNTVGRNRTKTYKGMSDFNSTVSMYYEPTLHTTGIPFQEEEVAAVLKSYDIGTQNLNSAPPSSVRNSVNNYGAMIKYSPRKESVELNILDSDQIGGRSSMYGESEMDDESPQPSSLHSSQQGFPIQLEQFTIEEPADSTGSSSDNTSNSTTQTTSTQQDTHTMSSSPSSGGPIGVGGGSGSDGNDEDKPPQSPSTLAKDKEEEQAEPKKTAQQLTAEEYWDQAEEYIVLPDKPAPEPVQEPIIIPDDDHDQPEYSALPEPTPSPNDPVAQTKTPVRSVSSNEIIHRTPSPAPIPMGRYRAVTSLRSGTQFEQPHTEEQPSTPGQDSLYENPYIFLPDPATPGAPRKNEPKKEAVHVKKEDLRNSKDRDSTYLALPAFLEDEPTRISEQPPPQVQPDPSPQAKPGGSFLKKVDSQYTCLPKVQGKWHGEQKASPTTSPSVSRHYQQLPVFATDSFEKPKDKSSQSSFAQFDTRHSGTLNPNDTFARTFLPTDDDEYTTLPNQNEGQPADPSGQQPKELSKRFLSALLDNIAKLGKDIEAVYYKENKPSSREIIAISQALAYTYLQLQTTDIALSRFRPNDVLIKSEFSPENLSKLANSNKLALQDLQLMVGRMRIRIENETVTPTEKHNLLIDQLNNIKDALSFAVTVKLQFYAK